MIKYSFYLPLLLLVMPIILSAQDSFFSTIVSVNDQPLFNEKVKSIHEISYSNYSSREEIHPLDTTLIFQDRELTLYYSGESKSIYSEDRKISTKHFDDKGKLEYTIVSTYNETGRMTENVTTYEGKAAMMNSSKKLSYDEMGRLTNISENGLDLMKLEYLEGLVIKSISMDAGIIKMNSEVERFGDTLRYELKGDMDGLLALFGDLETAEKQMPKETTDLLIKNGDFHFFDYKSNLESGLMELQSENVFNQQFKLLEHKSSDYSGEKHFVFEYAEDGQLIKKIDQIKNETFHGEMNDEGHVIKTIEDSMLVFKEFDSKGNPILKLMAYEFTPNEISRATLIKYDYK